MLRLLCTLSVSLLLTSSASAQSIDAELAARSKEFTAAVKAKDAAKLASFYTEDAMAFGEGAPLTKGREAIRKDFEAMLKSGLAEMTTTMIEASKAGDIGYVVGTFAFPPTKPDTKEARHGYYVEIWKRVNGQWLIAYDTFSTEKTAAVK